MPDTRKTRRQRQQRELKTLEALVAALAPDDSRRGQPVVSSVSTEEEPAGFQPRIPRPEPERAALRVLLIRLRLRLSSPNAFHPSLLRALAVIRANYHRHLSLHAISAQAYCSGSYLARLFRTELGISCHQFLTAYRVEQATKRLVSEPRNSVSQIALGSGFSTLRSLERNFHAWVGCCPREYREGCLAGPAQEEIRPSSTRR